MSIESLSVDEAEKVVTEVSSLDALHELRTQEISNTKFPGGRKGVLDALESKRLGLLEEWRKGQTRDRRVPYAVVGNLVDDHGRQIPKGQVVTGVSKSKLEFFDKIGGIEYRESSP